MLTKLSSAIFSAVAVIGLVAATPTGVAADDDLEDYWEDYWDDWKDYQEDYADAMKDRRWRVYRPYPGYYYAPPSYYYAPPPYYSGHYYYRPYRPPVYRSVGPMYWEVWY